ncbi:MAG: CPBP family intramembrane metalloprotease [Puniceicoccales bacterium]|jgi:membrane protease YdiL (CAAX protease family)|nr:CPBP family intramembrane metalloprotease [Puniceicoccales bacterium]
MFILFGFDCNDYSWKGVVHLFILFFGALFTAATLSGSVYLISSEVDGALAQYVASKGICKIYERITLLAALISLPFFFRKCGIKNLADLGCNLKNVRIILVWTCIGALFMAVFTAVEILFGMAEIVDNHRIFDALIGGLPKFILCATVVGIFEEILFRGAILRAFYTALNPALAVVISSLFFAYAHTKIPLAANLTNGHINALSGFRCLIPMLFGFLYKFKAFQFAKLTLLGIILSAITIRNKSLNQAIGFHIGIVLMLFIANVFTKSP